MYTGVGLNNRGGGGGGMGESTANVASEPLVSEQSDNVGRGASVSSHRVPRIQRQMSNSPVVQASSKQSRSHITDHDHRRRGRSGSLGVRWHGVHLPRGAQTTGDARTRASSSLTGPPHAHRPSRQFQCRSPGALCFGEGRGERGDGEGVTCSR